MRMQDSDRRREYKGTSEEVPNLQGSQQAQEQVCRSTGLEGRGEETWVNIHARL